MCGSFRIIRLGHRMRSGRTDIGGSEGFAEDSDGVLLRGDIFNRPRSAEVDMSE